MESEHKKHHNDFEREALPGLLPLLDTQKHRLKVEQ